MRFGRNAPREKDTELKMTAMIDVVFQLLIFFLVGTKFRVPQGELEAYLPPKGAAQQLTKRDTPVPEIRITLLVSQAGGQDKNAPPVVRLDNTTAPGVRGGSLAWLQTEIERQASDPAVRENVPVIIEAEPHLPYKWVIRVLDICRQAKFQEVNFAASKRNQPPETGVLKDEPG
jgi:biopolymer transport protein ExbD